MSASENQRFVVNVAEPRHPHLPGVRGLHDVGLAHLARGEEDRGPEQQPPDRVVRPPQRDQRADAREGAEHDRTERVGVRALEGHEHDGRRGERDVDGEQAPGGGPHAPLLSHSDTCAGWTVSCTTSRTSALSASRSSSSRNRSPNASSVCAAS